MKALRGELTVRHVYMPSQIDKDVLILVSRTSQKIWCADFLSSHQNLVVDYQMPSRILQNFQVNMDTRFLHLEFPEYLGICTYRILPPRDMRFSVGLRTCGVVLKIPYREFFFYPSEIYPMT